MTLKELFRASKKEEIYKFYVKMVKKPKTYEKITRLDIYHSILEYYQIDPEAILRLCSIEEINALKNLLNEEQNSKSGGYIEYLIFNNLKQNYLVIEEDKYYIPKDLINYIKMAINLYDEKEYALKDMLDSVILGITRIYNVLQVDKLLLILKSFNGIFTWRSLKDYIINNLRLNDKVAIKKYKGIYYVISLENLFYKDVLRLRKNEIPELQNSLEEIISIGKYKINLFKEPVFKFLNFLEFHLDPLYIAAIIEEMIIYAGLDLNDKEVLKLIANDILPLYNSLIDVAPFFSCWI